ATAYIAQPARRTLQSCSEGVKPGPPRDELMRQRCRLEFRSGIDHGRYCRRIGYRAPRGSGGRQGGTNALAAPAAPRERRDRRARAGRNNPGSAERGGGGLSLWALSPPAPGRLPAEVSVGGRPPAE